MRKRELLFRSIIVMIVLCAALGVTSYILRKDEAYAKNQEFYEEDDTYDVLFFGSSHSVMGVLPMELWNDYGITSYNLSNGGQRLAVDYWLLKEALEHQTPSLVVIDTYTTNVDAKYDDSLISSIHESLDSMPLSKTKIEAVYDTFPEENRAEFLVPFSVYHNRWESISQESFQKTKSYQKGAYENGALATLLVTPMERMDTTIDTSVEVPETVNLEYLRKSIELCREKDIPVLLIMTPHNEETYFDECVNAANMVASEYNVPFINGLWLDVIDTQTDLRDAGHLNGSGARKWTDYLGAYITENYGIADKRADEAYAAWNSDYVNYTYYKLDCLENAIGLNSYMITLQDDAFNYGVYVPANAEAFSDEQFWLMMKNAGVDSNISDSAQAYYCVINHETGEVTEYFGTEAMVQFAMKTGMVNISEAGEQVQILVMDRQTEDALTSAAY